MLIRWETDGLLSSNGVLAIIWLKYLNDQDIYGFYIYILCVLILSTGRFNFLIKTRFIDNPDIYKLLMSKHLCLNQKWIMKFPDNLWSYTYN